MAFPQRDEEPLRLTSTRAHRPRRSRSKPPNNSSAGIATSDDLDLGNFTSARAGRLLVNPVSARHPKRRSENSGAVKTASSITALPARMSARCTGLSDESFALFQNKQKKLRNPGGQVARSRRNETTASRTRSNGAADATLVFAQEAAGTAVCISSSGLILTCSHCIAEDSGELDLHASHWLLFSSGQAVEAKCIVWDEKRDLALLQVLRAESAFFHSTSGWSFPSLVIAASRPKLRSRLMCIGHPGSEDLEDEIPGRATGYDVLHISKGVFHGYAPGTDLQNNAEIGAFRHDCWTYWGHSGAPIVEEATGSLVGLHSSWDDQTGMRHGIPLEAIQQFLQLAHATRATGGVLATTSAHAFEVKGGS